ncbi:DNA-binding response regulator [Minicystis rosea]|nr:DNA-binding response regulator [Minicystis rosea]
MKRVLVIDDDEGFREALGIALTLEGYTVESAANGREALDLLRRASHPPHVFIVDLMMPVMNGWEFIEAVRHDPALAKIPLVVVSAAHDPGQIPPGVVALSKPVNLSQILQVLEGAIVS